MPIFCLTWRLTESLQHLDSVINGGNFVCSDYVPLCQGAPTWHLLGVFFLYAFIAIHM